MKAFKCSVWLVAILLSLPATTWAGAGDLDPTFGTGGIVSHVGTNGGLVLLPDGKLVVAGGGFDANNKPVAKLSRYNSDGSLDSTFGNAGLATTPALAFTLARQPDGKLVVGGLFWEPPNDPSGVPTPRFAVARLNADGSPDTSFGNGGFAYASISEYDWPNALALQPDGKVLAAGEVQRQVLVYGVPHWRSSAAVVRFNVDGSLDESFGTHGKVTTDIAQDTGAVAVSVRSDGTILVAGDTGNNDDPGLDRHLVLIRYLANGRLDASFGSGGIVLSVEGGTSAGQMWPLSGGKILTAGVLRPGDTAALLRYNPDGSLDSTFGDQGITRGTAGANFGAVAMVERSDGSIVGASSDGSTVVLLQYTAAGVPDPYFGYNGIVVTAVPGAQPSAMVLQTDNKVVVAGLPYVFARFLDGVCGNGVLESGEECDDGNLTNGDGCDANCTRTRCGNGVQSPGEACDDGNQNDRDACKNDCTLNVCGDGVVYTGVEACDDGNAIDDDGCNNSCQRTACGDGVVQPSEECDDGNTVSGDGCDANCFIEQCGNGRVEANEQCDDGAATNGGPCTPDCHWSLQYDAVLDPVRSMGLTLQPGQDDATYTQYFYAHSATTSIFDLGVPPPVLHVNQLVVDEGDCPPGTIVSGPQPVTFPPSVRESASVTVHVTRAAFPLATEDTPQWCTLHFTVQTVPAGVWDTNLQNNTITVPFGVWAAGASAVPTSFTLQSVKPQHVTIARHRIAATRHVRVKLSIGRPDPTRTITVTMQDGTCPAGTVDSTASVAVALPRKRAAISVPLTFNAGAFWTPAHGSPARCTPVVTAVDTGADAGMHVTQFDVDVMDRNDM